ncbi:hypothetical protein LJR289_005813 [Pseudoduganella sp. LjRoot289]|uniref:hypothetical protein n=1 Tax=Pseudoduganella sp. LjRoot289 TaxID=3342314 RepID=UPI003ED0BF85
MELQRITTEYLLAEDRVRLSGVDEAGQPVLIWLTLRMLQRMVPALLRRLEVPGAQQPHAEVIQGFAQQAARAAQQPQQRVQPGLDSPAWVAVSVDVAFTPQAAKLTLRGPQQECASVILEMQPLRQWLNILYQAYGTAEWPLAVWPAWLREDGQPVMAPGAVLH